MTETPADLIITGCTALAHDDQGRIGIEEAAAVVVPDGSPDVPPNPAFDKARAAPMSSASPARHHTEGTAAQEGPCRFRRSSRVSSGARRAPTCSSRRRPPRARTARSTQSGEWDAGCRDCAAFLDQIGHLAHLAARGTTFAVVSRATYTKILPFQARMGWTLPWYS